MKRTLLYFLLFLLMQGSADAVKINGIYYNINTNGKVAEVSWNPDCYEGNIVIPKSVSYMGVVYNVTSIGEKAFINCYGLTSVIIPDGVTSIGQEAFEGCEHLTSVSIPESVTSIGDGVFSGCFSLPSVTIPNGVTSIGNNTFDNCSGMKSVTIPSGISFIGKYAFYNCISLTSVKIPESLTSIGRSVFAGCVGLTSVTIPDNVTLIGDYAFEGCNGLTSLTIPDNVTSIGSYAFAHCSRLASVTIGSGIESINQNAFEICRKLTNVYCYAKNVPTTNSSAFRSSDIENVTLHVPAASVSAYKAVEPWKDFKQIVALPTQESDIDDSDYIPFVKENGWKSWHVIRSNAESGCHHDEYRLVREKVEKAGKTYVRMNRIEDNLTMINDFGLLREEERKVYIFDSDMQEEHLMFDYSLKAGDTYETYSYDEQKEVTYKVLSVSDYLEGPEAFSYDYDEEADSMIIRHRYLKKWTVCRTDDESVQKIWIEGVGSLEGPLANLYNERPISSRSYLAYVDNYDYDLYLPFSFYDEFGQVHGCNLPIGEKYESSEDGHHQLTYELEGKRLHVYGKVFCNCGPNHYAYFIEEPREQTDDPLVRKFHLIIQDVEPLMWCEGLHATDFYVEGVNSAYDYYIVDNQGEEHHVINKAPLYVYRPFVEDGKVWAVKVVSDGPPAEEWIEYYYFDGDTIVNGQTAKRMLCDRITSRQKTSGEYVGAWYEQNKEVYFVASGKQQFELLYDFSLINYDTMPSPDGSTWVVYKWTGIYPGFKGTYFTLGQEFWYEGVGSNSWPFVNHPWGYDGDKGVLLECSVGDEVIYYNSAEGYPYGMGARKRFDFTHTIKTKPKARNRSGAESLYGEYNDLQLGISLDPLDDAYLVRITDESGKVVYEKSINASNIVGLNIDISAYAKGHYTVTMENSDEAFIGEFNAQTTGIREVRWKKEDGRSIIYNLQGQRLYSLQKGLNIVNGQKVFVK